MVDTMNKDQFEKNLALYGADITCWPLDMQKSGHAFASTAGGKNLMEAEAQLAALLEDGLHRDAALSVGRNADSFMHRLQEIPAQHKQQAQGPSGFLAALQAFFRSLDIEVSPTALVSQAAMFVVVLGLGVMLGLGGQMEMQIASPPSGIDNQVPEVDISAEWFAATDANVDGQGAIGPIDGSQIEGGEQRS
ncbi:MAG: hypothetical protein KUG56_07525 [Kordiimonadaceae bacterium]|nr:hypothetical protein [Kordiimonadaceae bacterium]